MKKISVFIGLFLVMSVLLFPIMREARKEYKIGLTALGNGNYEEAISHFKKAIEIEPYYGDAYFAMGRAYLKKGDRKKAIKFYYKAKEYIATSLELKKAIFDYWLEEAKIKFNEGNYDKGLSIVLDLSKEARNKLPLYEIIMDQAYRNNKLKDLLKYSKKVILMRKKEDIGDSETVLKAYYYYLHVVQNTNNYVKVFKFYHFANKLWKKLKNKVSDKTKNLVQKIKEEVVTSNPILKKYFEGLDYFKAKNWHKAKEIFEDLAAHYPEMKVFSAYLEKINNKIKADNLIREIKDIISRGRQMDSSTPEAREKQKKVFLQAREKLDEAVSYGIDKDEIDKINKVLDELISQCDDPDYKPDFSEKGLKDILNKFGKIAGVEVEEEKFPFEKYYQQAEEAYKRGDYMTAISLYSEILAQDDTYKDVKLKIEDCRTKMKARESKKIAYIVAGIVGLIIIVFAYKMIKRELPLRRKRKYMEKAQSYFENKKYEKAIEFFKKAFNYPLSPRETIKVNLGLANCYLKLGKYNEAIKYAMATLREEERNEQAHVTLARAYLKKKEISDNALYEYKYLLKLEPNNEELLELLCNYYASKEIVNKDAVDIYKKYLQKHPGDKKTLNILGIAYMEEGRTDSEAQILYEEILKYSPEKIEFRKMLVRIYLEKGIYEEVIKECQNIFKVEIDDKLVHNAFIDAHVQLKKITEAIIFYEKLSSNYPNSRELKRIIDKLKERRTLNPELDENSEGISEEQRSKIRQARGNNASISICPQCAKLNPLGAEKCTHCGADLL